MKSWTLIACAGLLALAGCTGSATPEPSKSDTQVTEEKQNTTAKSEDTKSENATTESKETAKPQESKTNNSTTNGSDAMSVTADKLHQGFKDAGFTISDYEAELHETSFDATNGTSFLGVDIDYIQNVRSAYDHTKNDNDVTVEDEYTSEGKILCVLRDLEDNTYELLGADEKQDLLVEVDDIQPEDLGTVKHILALTGFPAE